MYYPSSSQTYCTIERTDPVNTDTSTWSQSKVVGTTSTQANTFSLYTLTNTVVDSYSFKIRTQFTNTQYHYTPSVNVVITCGSTYTITQTSTPTSPYYMAHGDSADGFIIPTFLVTTHQTACPVNQWQVSSSGSSYVAHPDLNDATSVGGKVKPKSGVLANHQKYTFWLWVGASGGSKAMFGPFYLDVGCTTTSVNLV